MEEGKKFQLEPRLLVSLRTFNWMIIGSGLHANHSKGNKVIFHCIFYISSLSDIEMQNSFCPSRSDFVGVKVKNVHQIKNYIFADGTQRDGCQDELALLHGKSVKTLILGGGNKPLKTEIIFGRG